MTTSVGGPSALNLALQTLLSPRNGASDQSGISDAPALESTATSQAANGAALSNSSGDVLFAALDNDGDGKLSKAELQTGFQKLSQDMKSVLLNQQKSSDSDTDTTSQGAAASATATNSSATADSSMDAIQLLESLLQSLQGSSTTAMFSALDGNGDGTLSKSEFMSGPSSTSSATSTSDGAASLLSRADSNGDAGISNDEWTTLLQGLDRHGIGDLANQQGMLGQQQSANLNDSLSYLLQSIAS